MAKTAQTWRNRIVETGTVAAGELVGMAHPLNWRRHPTGQKATLTQGLDGVGWVQDVIVNRTTGRMLDGHLRVELAAQRGAETPVPVKWVELTEAEELVVLATLDPIAAMAVTDEAALAGLVQRIDDADLRTMAADVAGALGIRTDESEVPGGDAGAQLNRAEELKAEWGVERGQVWEIGRHRLMCGDAYAQEDREKIWGGLIPDMLHIDPPYGINIVQPRNGGSTGMPTGTVGIPSNNKIIQSNLYPLIEGDDRPFDPAIFLDLAPIVIMWGGNYFADKLPTSSCWIVWDKREDITRNTFADCELAWTNLAKPARLFHHLWNGLPKGSQHGERRTHPTEKPVALFEEIGRMFCPSGVWLDCFAGTGAQLVAAERIPEVRCFAMEIEPLYVAVTLQRMKDLGKTPVRVGVVDASTASAALAQDVKDRVADGG